MHGFSCENVGRHLQILNSGSIPFGEWPAHPSEEPGQTRSHWQERPTYERPPFIHRDLGLLTVCNHCFFLILLFSYRKLTSINKYLPKLLKFFLLAKYYVVKLQLLVHIQTSKNRYVLEEDWKNLDSFREATDERFQTMKSLVKNKGTLCLAYFFSLALELDWGKVEVIAWATAESSWGGTLAQKNQYNNGICYDQSADANSHLVLICRLL